MEATTINTQLTILQKQGSQKENVKKYLDTTPCAVVPLHKNLVLFAGIWIICMIIVPVCAQDNTTIHCGVILPLSGELGQSGEEFLSGIKLAADQINADSRTKYRIYLDIRDDTGDINTALSYFHEMQVSGIPVVIGSYATDVTLPMAEATRKNPETLLVAPHAIGMALYGISPAFYQLNAPVFHLGRFVSDWVSYTAKRVVILYIDNDYGRTLLEEIKSDLASGNVQIVGTEPVLDNTDLSALVQKALNGGPDTVIMVVYDSRAEDILTILADAGYRGQVVLTEASGIRNLESNITNSLSKFSVCTISTSTSLVPGSHTDDFVNAYMEEYGKYPTESYAGYGYDAIMLIINALKLGSEDGTISAKSLKDGFEIIRYYGVTGPKVFDEKNAVSPAMDRWVYRDGKFELMSTSVR